MECLALTSISLDNCPKPRKGGIYKIFFAPKSDIATKTFTDHLVTALTLAETKVWNFIELKKGIAFLNNELQLPSEMVLETLTFNIDDKDAATNALIYSLIHGSYVMVVIQESGTAKVFGLDDDRPLAYSRGAEKSAYTYGTGTVSNDFNGHVVTFQAESAIPTPFLSPLVTLPIV